MMSRQHSGSTSRLVRCSMRKSSGCRHCCGSNGRLGKRCSKQGSRGKTAAGSSRQGSGCKGRCRQANSSRRQRVREFAASSRAGSSQKGQRGRWKDQRASRLWMMRGSSSQTVWGSGMRKAGRRGLWAGRLVTAGHLLQLAPRLLPFNKRQQLPHAAALWHHWSTMAATREPWLRHMIQHLNQRAGQQREVRTVHQQSRRLPQLVQQ